MDFKFSRDTETKEPKQPVAGEKNRQNALLVLLLVLVGGFSYIYFFTGLIKPHPEQKPAEAPAPQVVKKPLPPHEGQPAKQETAAAPADKKESSPAKPEPAKVATAPSSPAPVSKTASPAESSKKQEPSKTVTEKKTAQVPSSQGQKQPPARSEQKVSADKNTPPPPEKKIAAADAQKKTAAADTDKKASAAKKAPEKQGGREAHVSKTIKPEKKIASASAEDGGRWTVVVGSYLLEDAMATDIARVRKAGLDAAVQPGPRKKTAMNRLFLSEFSDRSAAQSELDKLKRHTSDAFIIDHGGKHAVYAGSYLLDGRATSEKERLAAAGFSLAVKRVEVAIPSKNLVAGTFADKKAAEAAVKKLKESGLKASMVRQ